MDTRTEYMGHTESHPERVQNQQNMNDYLLRDFLLELLPLAISFFSSSHSPRSSIRALTCSSASPSSPSLSNPSSWSYRSLSYSYSSTSMSSSSWPPSPAFLLPA